MLLAVFKRIINHTMIRAVSVSKNIHQQLQPVMKDIESAAEKPCAQDAQVQCNRDYGMEIKDWRRPYLNKEEPEILEQNLPSADPFEIFDIWFKNVASRSNVSFEEINSACVSTCINNKPSSRMVLMKDYSKKGFVFYTNYDSRKGKEIEANPYAAVLFYWPKADRQVRIEGKVEKVPEKAADDYWYSRPLKSRIGSKISNQSSVIPDRQCLINKRNELTKLAEDKGESAITRPSTWGGYCVVPNYFEFWQGQSDRVHDRIVFELTSDGERWSRKRLSP